jgi:8-oxo-dGTP pyrophosphatase MutT (NUDIX family)
MSGKIEPGEKPAEAVTREAREELGVAVRPVGKVWECASVDGIHQLHWWLAELVDEEAPLRPNPREVESVKWIRPIDFSSVGRVFETDVRFFEEIYPALDC